MERVIKTFTGYGKVKINKPATHIVLTIEEFEKLNNEIQDTENEIIKAQEISKNKVEEIKKTTDKIILDEKENARKIIEAFQNDFNNAKNEIDRLNNLNSNLIRICKERANSKRKLIPKKTHSGYLILETKEHNNVFRWNGTKLVTESLPCWKTIIQSPYDCSIPYEVIEKNIYTDLVNFIGANLGLKYVYFDASKLKKKELIEEWNNSDNFIFKTSYKANNKSGFWEIEYLTKLNVDMSKEMIKNLNNIE